MKEACYAKEQIAVSLRQAEAGTAVAEVCRKVGASDETFYRSKKKQLRVHWAVTAAPGAASLGRYQACAPVWPKRDFSVAFM